VARGPDPKITAVDILEAFLASNEPAFVVSEIAEKLDVTAEGARHQMENLVEEGYLDRKKPSQRSVLYWVTDEGRQYYFDTVSSDSSD